MAVDAYKQKEEVVGAAQVLRFEEVCNAANARWSMEEHLAAMDHLRQGIHLRGYAQKNPKQNYKRESFELFEGLLDVLKSDVITILSKVRVQQQKK
ncbi:hypothetical protein OH492_23280 [Vibrio chagasii]|nr:hypothetical protein [Vibrio chagasii]